MKIYNWKENIKKIILNRLEKKGYEKIKDKLKRYRNIQKNIVVKFRTIFHKIFINKIHLIKNGRQLKRKLEIGPGETRIKGFETLNIVYAKNIDYIYNASNPLPFKSESFDIIYTSHILEHVPWYQVENTLLEWKRILKKKGSLEIWVPNGLKICKILTEFEEDGINNTYLDGWYKFNPTKDPCRWAAGRLFTYSDGYGTLNDPNWHRGLFTPRYLKQIMKDTGFEKVKELTKNDIRGYDHGWINLGMKGSKP